MLIDSQLFDSPEIDRTSTSIRAKDRIASIKQKFGKVSTILASNTSDYCNSHTILHNG